MELKDVISLAEAAEELGLGASTLRHQAQDGRLEARVVGKTWITTRQEVERYRRDNLGRVGRPGEPAGSIELARVDWVNHRHPRGFVRILGFETTPGPETEAVLDVIRDSIAAGAMTVGELRNALTHDDRTRELLITGGENPPFIGLVRVR